MSDGQTEWWGQREEALSCGHPIRQSLVAVTITNLFLKAKSETIQSKHLDPF
jgi:hypothetical protein